MRQPSWTSNELDILLQTITEQHAKHGCAPTADEVSSLGVLDRTVGAIYTQARRLRNTQRAQSYHNELGTRVKSTIRGSIQPKRFRSPKSS